MTNFVFIKWSYLITMERFIQTQNSGEFDLIIVGGGITGATLAYEASLKGLKVALFEKGDFGGATSSATSKLIHGGLRYLKNLEFGLVRESLRERKILSNIAPNFVYPLPFMIPTFTSLKSNKWVLMSGMLMYDWLSYDKGRTWDSSKKLPRFRVYSSKKTRELESCVKNKGLTGSDVYYDCQNIFPERLTLAFLKSAEKLGAKISNYAKVVSFLKKDNKVQGVIVKDEINNIQGEFMAPVVVNCAGPWADILIKSATITETKHTIRRSEGIHIITKKLCNNHAVSVMTKSQRHVMVMPWRNHSLIGTTDKEYIGSPDDYKVSKKSIQDLLDDVNANYSFPKLTYDNVLFYYGGLRPLADTETENSYESSRKYEIFDNADEGLSGLLTVEGGKYTTSRQLAVKVMEKVSEKLKVKLPNVKSSERYLYGSEIKNLPDFINQLHNEYPGFQYNTIDYVGKNYGTESREIFKIAQDSPEMAEVLNKDGEILAEVAYAIEKESALYLSDILFRRTGIGGLGHPGKDVLQKVASIAGKLLNWDKATLDAEIQRAEERFHLPEN